MLRLYFFVYWITSCTDFMLTLGPASPRSPGSPGLPCNSKQHSIKVVTQERHCVGDWDGLRVGLGVVAKTDIFNSVKTRTWSHYRSV